MDRWDYRVIEFREDGMEQGFKTYGIHEVFYEAGKPVSYAISPAAVVWDEFDAEHPGRSVQSVGRDIVAMFAAAVEKPVLKASDFPSESRE